ncbi:hypothetical protein [Mesorhizobium sp. YM1C-6-2]|uniref:hypothetical protein n=1 Tax=Mesorhizobium sp. YM1C-6-2 TaxID=1827501 RepID=UPI000EF240AC|nr:hypothetical protein [Mesorhizobium sp. YM1C-6-2]RLP26007.1 hypothetical protein D8676_09905 [Mesorhizobium sp. YM1C-6-2]
MPIAQSAIMQATRILLSIFPLTLVGVLAAERCALLWLGTDPASPLAWEVWLKMRAAFGRMWQTVETSIGGSISSHFLALLLIAAIVVLVAWSRRWRSYSFLSNHIALLVAVASFVMASQAKVSSLAAVPASSGNWAVTWIAQFSPVQLLLLCGGIASCVLCHLAVLKHLNERSAAVSLRVRMLQKNL